MRLRFRSLASWPKGSDPIIHEHGMIWIEDGKIVVGNLGDRMMRWILIDRLRDIRRRWLDGPDTPEAVLAALHVRHRSGSYFWSERVDRPEDRQVFAVTIGPLDDGSGSREERSRA